MNTPGAAMPSPGTGRERRFYLWVIAITVLMAGGLVALLFIFDQQTRIAREAGQLLQADSLHAIVFQHEREFMRLRERLRVAQADPRLLADQETQLRQDIYAGRLSLLRDSPSVEPLGSHPAYQALLPELQNLVARVDALLQQPDPVALQAVLRQMETLGPRVQALSTTADIVLAQRMDSKMHALQQPRRLVLALLAGLALLWMTAAVALWRQQRALLRERSQLHAINDALRQAHDAAESAHRLKSQFLANMSHELRTPFQGLLGMLDLLADEPLSPQQRLHWQRARASAAHLLSVLNDVLDHSALEAGQLRLLPEPVQLPALVRETVQWLQPQAAQKDLTLRCHLPVHDTPAVLADPKRVRQVLLNLIGNAIKFTEHGGVDVTLHAQPAADGQAIQWRLSVSDTGIGIDPDQLPRLFQRFEQADPSISRRYGGTGLGLNITRALLRLMAGDIEVTSTPGQGSTFTARWCTPLAPPAPQALAADAAPTAPGLYIRVADDHPTNRELLGLLLQRLGHRVTLADNGAQAVQLASSEDFDLVLMDVHMPDLDGLQATRQIRALSGPRARVPIIALSADALDEADQRAHAAGVDAFIAKPVPRETLQALLAHWARRKRAPSPPKP
jgi:signal transduction histidine kinase/CheY-like chemotaxis protein